MKFLSIFILLIAIQCSITAQISVRFYPSFSGQDIAPNTENKLDYLGHELTIKALKFYISNVRLAKSGVIVYSEENSFHLINALDSTRTGFVIPNNNVEFDELLIDIGVDSVTNVSGAFDGDLDPTLGMYWTWQSGYINFKLEGSYAPLATRNHEYAFHLGGYLPPFQTVQSLSLPTPNNNEVIINLSVFKLLNIINLLEKNKIMSPGDRAKEISSQLPKVFSIKP